MVLKNLNLRHLQRHLQLVERSHLTKIKPLKTKIKGLSKTGGRNNYGRITAKKVGINSHRFIDLVRDKTLKVVVSLEYDPNRTANIARILENNEHL